MRDYELTVIIDPNIAEEDVPQAIEKLNTIIAKSDGNVKETDHWGRRKLAYPIDHRGEGNYVLLKLELEPEKAVELETNLNLPEEYLRHLLVRISN